MGKKRDGWLDDLDDRSERPERPRNLASALSRVKLKPEALTDEDVQILAMELILDQDPWDEGQDAQRARVKLDALQFIHKVRKDSRPEDAKGESDFEVWKVKAKG